MRKKKKKQKRIKINKKFRKVNKRNFVKKKLKNKLQKKEDLKQENQY